MTIDEYLDTDNGKELTRLFEEYFEDAKKQGYDWWYANCSRFAIMSEAWTVFHEGLHWDTVDEIDEDFAAASPKEIFDGVECWSTSDDAAIILTCNYDDARNEEVRDAWTFWKEA